MAKNKNTELNKNANKKETSNISSDINENISFDIQEEFDKLTKKLSTPTNVITSVWNNDLIEDFNNFIDKLINTLGNIVINDDIYNRILAELNTIKDFSWTFLNKFDINILKSGIDDDLYYKILTIKYSDLWFFLQQFWSRVLEKTNNLENIEKIKEEKYLFDISEYKKVEAHKKEYQKMLDLLKNNIDKFEKQLREFRLSLLKDLFKEIWVAEFKKLEENDKKIINVLWNKDNKELKNKLLSKLEYAKNSPEYQVLRYIWLKNKNFRAKVLDNILDIDLSKLKLKYSKYYEIAGKLNQIKNNWENYNWNDKENIKKELKKIVLNSNSYFEIEEKIINSDNKKNNKRWWYVKYLTLKDIDFDNLFNFKEISSTVDSNYDIKEYVANAIIYDKSKFDNIKKEIDKKSENITDSPEKNNIEQKKATLKIIEKLFIIKNIILKVEDDMWYSPWIKVFVKQWLAEKINFEEEKFKRLQYLLYFVVAQNYTEYETLKKFFDETKNSYQKWNIKNKFLSTLSIIVFAIFWYFFFKMYTDSPIYTTNLFIIISISAFILWYFKKFRIADNIDLELINKKLIQYKKYIVWLFLFIIVLTITLFNLGFISIKLIIDILSNNVLYLILIVTIISMVLAIFAKKYKWINSGLYKIITFSFLIMFFAGFSNQSVQESILNNTKSLIKNSIWINKQLVAFLIPENNQKKEEKIQKAIVNNQWTWNTQNIVKKENNLNNNATNILKEPKNLNSK